MDIEIIIVGITQNIQSVTHISNHLKFLSTHLSELVHGNTTLESCIIFFLVPKRILLDVHFGLKDE